MDIEEVLAATKQELNRHRAASNKMFYALIHIQRQHREVACPVIDQTIRQVCVLLNIYNPELVDGNGNGNGNLKEQQE